jgi:GGDEF domain-containing protein
MPRRCGQASLDDSVFGKNIARWIRGTDVCARIGEDTLSFLLLDTDLEGARIFYDRIREHLAVSEFQFPPFCAGVALFPEHGSSSEGLIDLAVTAAKNPDRRNGGRHFLHAVSSRQSPNHVDSNVGRY